MNEQEYLCWFCTLRNERHIIYFVVQSMHSNMLGWQGGLARVQLCWILAKYSPLHHTSCSQIVHVRKLRFRLGSVSFFVASVHLPSCSLRNMISFVHRHVYELFDHFFENLNGFLNPYSRSSRFFVLNFTPFLTLMSKVCGISFKSFPCVICLTRSSQAQARIACCFSLGHFASSSYPHMPWQGLHGTSER